MTLSRFNYTALHMHCHLINLALFLKYSIQYCLEGMALLQSLAQETTAATSTQLYSLPRP